jgi:hypothetical protein
LSTALVFWTGVWVDFALWDGWLITWDVGVILGGGLAQSDLEACELSADSHLVQLFLTFDGLVFIVDNDRVNLVYLVKTRNSVLNNFSNRHCLGNGLSKRTQGHGFFSLVVEFVKDVVDEVSGLDGPVDTDDAIRDSLSLRPDLLVLF